MSGWKIPVLLLNTEEPILSKVEVGKLVLLLIGSLLFFFENFPGQAFHSEEVKKDMPKQSSKIVNQELAHA